MIGCLLIKTGMHSKPNYRKKEEKIAILSSVIIDEVITCFLAISEILKFSSKILSTEIPNLVRQIREHQFRK